MIEEGLKVKFTGDADQLATELQQLESRLKRFENAVKTASNPQSLATFQRAVDATKAKIDALTRSQTASSQAVNKSTRDFTGWTRVIQDAPFGFIAISNNLEQLIPAAGGAGIAFSALISIVSFAQIGFANWTRGITDSKDALKEKVKKLHEAKEALSNYVESLNDINKAQVLGNQNAQEQLVKLQTLYNATQNANIPLADRKKLVDQLQEQYPKYFANIKDEIILAGGASKAYNNLRDSILASSKARAFEDVAVEKQKEKLVLEKEYADLAAKAVIGQQKLQQQEAKSKELRDKGADVRGKDLKLNEQLRYSLADEFKLRTNMNAALDASKAKMKEITTIQNGLLLLEQQTQNVVEKNPGALLNPTGKVKATASPQFNFFDRFFDVSPKTASDKAKQALEMYQTAVEFASKNFDIFKGLDAVLFAPDREKTIEAGKIFWKNFQQGLVQVKVPKIVIGKDDIPFTGPDVDDTQVDKFIRGISGSLDKTGIPPIIIDPEVEIEWTKQEKARKQFQEQLTSVVEGAAEGVAGSFGEGLGQAFAGGGFDKIFQSITASIGGFLQQLGKLLIETAIKFKLFKTALYTWATTNPALAIAAGVGLIAAGAFIKNASLPKPKGFAAGGIVSGPVFGMVGEGSGTSSANPEIIAPLDRLTDLVGGGGGNFPAYLPVHEISGDTLRLWYARANASGRMFG